MEVQGCEEKPRPLGPRSFPQQTPGVRDPPWEKLLPPDSLRHPAVCPHGPGGGGDAIAASSSVFKPLAPPPWIPIAPDCPIISKIQCLPAFLGWVHLESTTSIPSQDDPSEHQHLMFSRGFPSHGMPHSQPPLARESRVCQTC